MAGITRFTNQRINVASNIPIELSEIRPIKNKATPSRTPSSARAMLGIIVMEKKTTGIKIKA